jgi:selenocysteine lyase/cysteine desulfurase
VSGLRVYGITDVERLGERAPTFAVSLDGYTAQELSATLGELGIFTYAGHYYAIAVMERLGVLDSGGLLRIGFANYNTAEEIDRLVETLLRLS